MVKKKIEDVLTAEKLVEGIENSPYYPVACKMLLRKNIDDPTLADLLDCYSEIAKIDHKINRKNG